MVLIIPTLKCTVKSRTPEVRALSLACMMNLAAAVKHRSYLAQPKVGILTYLIQAIREEDEMFADSRVHALSTIKNLCTDHSTNAIAMCQPVLGLLDLLIKLLKDSKSADLVKVKVIGIIRNMMTVDENKSFLSDSSFGLVQLLVKVVKTSKHVEAQLNALVCLHNLILNENVCVNLVTGKLGLVGALIHVISERTINEEKEANDDHDGSYDTSDNNYYVGMRGGGSQ